MLPLKTPIDPYLNDVGNLAERMLRWKHVLVRTRLKKRFLTPSGVLVLATPAPPPEGERVIYQARFYAR